MVHHRGLVGVKLPKLVPSACLGNGSQPVLSFDHYGRPFSGAKERRSIHWVKHPCPDQYVMPSVKKGRFCMGKGSPKLERTKKVSPRTQ